MHEEKPQSGLILGAHLSIAKGFDQALFNAAKAGSNAVQIFTKNANTWREKQLTELQIAAFQAAREKTGITEIASHTSYLINIAGADADKTAMSVEALYQELIRCTRLGIPYLVLHPGAHLGDGETAGIQRIADNLNAIFDRLPESPTRVLLETTAGQGSALGHTFEQVAAMGDKITDPDRVGFCLDTSHVFAAGYNLADPDGYESTIGGFDAIVGLSRLHLLHVNDSKKPLGSRVDRHEHIGEGHIGPAAFARLVTDPRLSRIAKIIETPKDKNGKDADPINLTRLRRFYAGEDPVQVLFPVSAS